MLNLIKHLKPFIWSIVIIFGLLFGQAMADLALPSYMADIVNIGIQNNGIENSVPRAISQTEYQKITLFLSADNKELVTANYQLLDIGSLSTTEAEKYLKDYLALANEPVYILKAQNNDSNTQLNDIFGIPILLVSSIEQKGASAIPGLADMIPAGADPFLVIAKIPQAQMDQMLAQASSGFTALPKNIIQQTSAAYLKTQYNALGMNLVNIQTVYIVKIGGLMLLLTLLAAVASLGTGFLSARVAAGLGRNLRQQIFTRVESFSNTEFDRFSTASLITRSTNDITQVQMLLVMLFRIAFYAPILGVGGVIKVIGSEAGMTWIIAAAVIAMLMLVGVMLIVAVPKFKVIQKLVDKLNLVTREILSGLMVIRAFNTQKAEEAKFDAANKDLTRINLFISRVTVMLMPLMMLIMNLVTLLIVWVGAKQVDAGTTQVGNLIAFMQYAMQIIMSFLMVSMVFVMMPRAIVSVQRINEVLETEPVIVDPKKPHNFDPALRGQVEFRNVSFRYPGAEVDLLKNISFTIKPGQTTAVIGSTGTGKTTLINLIPRFYDVTGGAVLVDGVDVREVTQHDLREKIGYVSQKTLLFSGTIESNIKYANENASLKEVENYARTAQAMEFITSSEKGLATPVAQGGSNFSGGQKQRLSIARALAKQPEIFIFDDSFSALDYTTDAALRKALRQETNGAAVVIVTQRISTVMHSEQIIVLDQGKIVGIGTHEHLMATSDVYREIAQSQLSKEELAS
jgi:ATP-binding cassette, subfamily B, multidrug efflux pump